MNLKIILVINLSLLLIIQYRQIIKVGLTYRLEGYPSSKKKNFYIDTGVIWGGGGAKICNEGPPNFYYLGASYGPKSSLAYNYVE